MRDPFVQRRTIAARMSHLDAIRGIAAAAVVIHHALLSIPAGHDVIGLFDRIVGLRIISLGRPAVILFFVLSGFVLTRSIQSRPPGAALFAARRVVRLLPPYWVVLGLSFAAVCLLPHHKAAGMSAWFNEQWGGGLDGLDFLRHLAMLSPSGQYPLDHVAWSLVHELRFSILLPVLVLFFRRDWVLPSLAAAGLVALGAEIYIVEHRAAFPAGLNGFLFDAPGPIASFILTARFALDFIIGLALAARWPEIEALFARRQWLFAPALLVAFFFLSATAEIAMAAGAALLIAAVGSSQRAASLLDVPSLEWLGRVSYSLYLVHLPIMLTCGLLLDGIAPPSLALAIAVAISLPAADLLHRLVEAPSIRWGRALGARSAKIPVPAVPAAEPALVGA